MTSNLLASGSSSSGTASPSAALMSAPVLPTATALTVSLAADSGSSASDNITQVRTLNVGGLDAGRAWQYSLDRGTTWQTGSGSQFQLTAYQTLADVTASSISARLGGRGVDSSIAATVVDFRADGDIRSAWLVSATGAITDGVRVEFTVDANGLVQVRQTEAAWTAGVHISDWLSAKRLSQPLVSSSGVNGAGVAQLFVNGTQAGSGFLGTGNTVLNDRNAYEAGDVLVRQTDASGHTATAANTAKWVVDIAAVAPYLSLVTDSGSSASDGVTRFRTVKVTGLESGSWEYSLDGGSSWQTGTGNSFDLPTPTSVAGTAYAAGSIQVRQTDVAGNTGKGSNAMQWVLDTSAGSLVPSLLTDSGSNATDGVTRVRTVNVGGLESGAVWQYSVDGGASWQAGKGSSFDLPSATSVTGVSYDAGRVQVRQTDAAGNTASAGNASKWVLDTAIDTPALSLAVDSSSRSAYAISGPGVIADESNAPVVISTAARLADLDVRTISLTAGGESAGVWLDEVALTNPVVMSSNAEQMVVRFSHVSRLNSTRTFYLEVQLKEATGGITVVKHKYYDSTGWLPPMDFSLEDFSAKTLSGSEDGITNGKTVNVGGLESGATWQYSLNGGSTWVDGKGSSFDLPLSASNLLANPGFTEGDAGWSTDYVRQTSAGGAKTVAVVTTAPTWLSGIRTGPAGSGDKFLVVDGGPSASDAFWRQSVELQAGKTYRFSYDVASGDDGQPQVQFFVGGTAVGSIHTLTRQSGWQSHEFTFKATSTGRVELAMKDLTTAAAGNDIALDNLSLRLDATDYAVNSVQVRQIDAVGNISEVGGNKLAWQIDTTAPVGPSLSLTSDSGSSSSDGRTRVRALNVGRLEAGASLQIQVDGGAWTDGRDVRLADLTSADIDAQLGGGWISNKSNAVRVTDLKTEGNTRNAWLVTRDDVYTKGVQVEISQDPDGRLRAKALKAAYVTDNVVDSWESQSARYIDAGVPATSDGDAGYGVAQFAINGLQAGTGFLGNSSATALDHPVLMEGTHSYALRQVDKAGNVSAAATATYTLDTHLAAPVITSGGSSRFIVSGLEEGASWRYTTDWGRNWTTGTGGSGTTIELPPCDTYGNHVLNGDFRYGYVDYTSGDYGFVGGAHPGIHQVGLTTEIGGVFDLHGGAGGAGDPFLVVDGSQWGSFWMQSQPTLEAGRTYNVSYSTITTPHSRSVGIHASIQFTVEYGHGNWVDIGAAQSTAGDIGWTRHSLSFTPSAKVTRVAFRDNTWQEQGNDFGFDAVAIERPMPSEYAPGRIQVEQTDSLGNTTTARNSMTFATTPLALDLDASGNFETVSADASGGLFDLRNDGHAVASAWIGKGDAWLAVDRNGNGRIDNRNELFGGEGEHEAFAKLALHDSNSDGAVDAADAGHADVLLWRDANGDHQSQPGELLTLAEAGVRALRLTTGTDPSTWWTDAAGVIHGDSATAVLASGTEVRLTDLWLPIQVAGAAPYAVMGS